MAAILVPVDFSELSINALRHAYKISSMYQAHINMIYVIEDNPLFNFVNENELSELISRVENRFGDLKKEAEKITKKEAHYFITRGKVVDKILEKAKELKVKFLVMGTSGSADIRKKIVGTNTLRIIKEADFPILSIKGNVPVKDYKTIVLPIDLTKETTQKVRYAIQFAKFFDAKVHLISVVNSGNYIVNDTLVYKLEQTCSSLSSENIRCEAKIEYESNSSSKVANKILEYCNKVNADLIMIMTQQEVKTQKFFLGSLAKEIVNKANLPVLSINPK